MTTMLMPNPKQQYFFAAGIPLVGGKIYTYSAGTNNPKQTFTDPAGTIPQANPIILNARGEPASPIFWSGNYKVEIRDALNNLIYTVDNYNTDPAGLWNLLPTLAGSGGSALIGFLQDGVGAVAQTMQTQARVTVTPENFGAVGDGVTNDTAAFTKAITYLVSIGGGQLFLSKNAYALSGTAGADGILNGILIPFVGGSDTGATSISIEIVGKSRDTKLLANSNNMYVVRMAAAYCSLRNVSIHANGKTGVTGLALVPQNISGPDTNSQQSFNQIDEVYISQCAEGIILQCGGVGGAYYNVFKNVHVHGGNLTGTRGVYFKTGVGPGTPSNANRNQFYSLRVAALNTGIDIESGDTNEFFGCSAEGVNVGTLPSATPTAIIIDNLDGNGRGNDQNRFYGFTAEACTADMNIQNDRTGFYGCYLTATKSTVSAGFATAGTFVGPYDLSIFPEIQGGRVVNGGNLPTGLSAALYEVATASGGQPITDSGGKFKSYPLTMANVTNLVSINDARSYYMKSGKWVDWSVRFVMHPVADNSVLSITAPFTADFQVYADFSIVPPLEIPIVLQAGTTTIIGVARFNYTPVPSAGTLLEIVLPTGVLWDVTPGNNNVVQFNIRYRQQ